MKTELTPLEALERIRSHNYHEHNKKECLEIIEIALKDRIYLQKQVDNLSYVNIQKDKIIKAFEIIKEKNVNCELVKHTRNVIEYNKALGGLGVAGARHFRLTQEEYYLLREVLL